MVHFLEEKLEKARTTRDAAKPDHERLRMAHHANKVAKEKRQKAEKRGEQLHQALQGAFDRLANQKNEIQQAKEAEAEAQRAVDELSPGVMGSDSKPPPAPVLSKEQIAKVSFFGFVDNLQLFGSEIMAKSVAAGCDPQAFLQAANSFVEISRQQKETEAAEEKAAAESSSPAGVAANQEGDAAGKAREDAAPARDGAEAPPVDNDIDLPGDDSVRSSDAYIAERDAFLARAEAIIHDEKDLDKRAAALKRLTADVSTRPAKPLRKEA